MIDADLEFAPPPGPPPFLSWEQQDSLCRQGWLFLDNLPEEVVVLLGDLSREAGKFFDHDPSEKSGLYPKSHGTELGYYPVPNEKEYLTFRREKHETSSLEVIVQKCWHVLGHLLHRILCDLSRTLGLQTSIWDGMVKDSLSFPEKGTDLEVVKTLLRVFRYYPEAGFAEPHVDIGLLTLCMGDKDGLQVWDTSVQPPQWREAGNRPCLLVGQYLRVLLLGTASAGRHRVVPNAEGRSSVVFTLRPCTEGSINIADFGGPSEEISMRELFYKIKGSKYNINAQKGIRDRQREAQQKQKQELPEVSVSPKA